MGNELKKEDVNLRYYEHARGVPAEAQKSFSNGKFSGTDINPMWRIKKLTELFGPCGIGWYYQPVTREIQEAPDGTKVTFVAVNLYVNENGEWSKPIYGEGGNKFVTKRANGSLDVSDEGYKMAVTDALSNATKQLGIGADIWFANDKQHSTKYDLQMERMSDDATQAKKYSAEQSKNGVKDEPKAEVNTESKPEEPTFSYNDAMAEVKAAQSVDELKSIWTKYASLQKNKPFVEAVGTRKAEIKKS